MYCPICSQHAWDTGRDLHLLPVFTETPALLEEKIRELENVNHTKLVSLCKTRWVARIEAYEAFQELLTAVVDSLQDIATEDGWNSESSRKTSSLLSAVRQFGFIHTFTVVRHDLGFIKGITTSLQSRAHDIVCAYNEIVHVVQRIEEVRQCIDDEHAVWFAKAETLSDTIGCDAPTMPRICGRQQNRSSTPATTASEYFKRITAIPFFDQLLSQMQCRFRICKRRLLLQWQSCLRAYPFSKWRRKWSLYMVQIFLLQLPSQRNSLFGNTSGRTSPLLKHLPP